MSSCDGITQTHSFVSDMLVMVYDESTLNKPALYRQYVCTNCLDARHKFLSFTHRSDAVKITKDKLIVEE